MKTFLPILLLTILIFSAAAPVYGQGEDPPVTPTQLYQQDTLFEHITTEDVTALSHANPVENLLGAQGRATLTDILILTDERGE